MRYLALTLPGGGKVIAPNGIPTGGGGTAETIIQNSIVLVLVLATLLSLGMLLWAGIAWTMSGGDKQKVQAARARLTYAIVGLIVSFFSFFIISIVGSFFGVPLIPTTDYRPPLERITPEPAPTCGLSESGEPVPC